MPDVIKRTIGYGRWMKLRECMGGPKLYNDAFDRHRSIFIHIPKAAGTSVGEALFGAGNSTHHYWDFYQAYDPEKFARYYKFTFVRNPFDRLVSAYTYLQQTGKSTSRNDRRFRARYLSRYGSFKEFVCAGLNRPAIKNWGHFIPQSRFIASDDRKIQVDFVGRVENMARDFVIVAERLKLPTQITHTNKSQRDHFSKYYDSESEEIVREHYRRDFELLGYPENVG
ncbi:MAG: sulfotransferase family protein [Novipirellula sp. JB048]